jgi:hypothetical protein
MPEAGASERGFILRLVLEGTYSKAASAFEQALSRLGGLQQALRCPIHDEIASWAQAGADATANAKIELNGSAADVFARG